MSEFDAEEFLGAFLVEATEHVSFATRQLLDVEAALAGGGHNRRAVREAYRALHTIKGLAGMVGVDPIVDLAHAMEAVLRSADAAGGRLDPGRVDLLLSGVRDIEARLRALSKDRPVAPAPAELVDALLDAQLASADVGSVPMELELGDDLGDKLQSSDREILDDARRRNRRGFRVDFVPSPEKNEQGISITAVRERVARVAEIVRVLPISRPVDERAPAGLAFTLVLVTDADPEAIADAAHTSRDEVHPLWNVSQLPAPEPLEVPEEPLPSSASTAFVRVEVKRLDDALEKLSAVLVNRFRLVRAVNELRDDGVDVRTLFEIVASGGRQLRELRSAIMRARMVPVSEFLERVPLIVRSLSRSTGKSVRLELDVGRAEVDKSVAERIFPAVVHLVRNAVDHGIEPPEVRARAGKPEAGLVRIGCRELGSSRLELLVEDDGRGIDRDAISQRVGRPIPEGDAALLEVLRQPGLTTAERASHTSGRGLGMDIIDRIVSAQLGGSIAVSTALSRGTRFTINIPLSITIVDAFTLSCAGRTFAVPVGSIEEILEVPPERTTMPPGSGIAERMVERRGEVVPLIDLGTRLRLDDRRDRSKALLVRRNDQAYAFAVDRMLGRQEVVIRPLEDPLVHVAGVAGATDLGDGRPTLVLDLPALAAELGQNKELVQ